MSGKEIQGLAPEVLPLLMSHDFPGNVRELENIIEYAIVVCRDNLIGIEHLPDYLRAHLDQTESTMHAEHGERDLSWDELERFYLYETLKKNNWNRSATAAEIGIHTTTLWRKIKRLHLKIPNQSGRKSGH